ncbi:MAG: hypothetical protein HQ479_00280 [Rhodobacter sp.]|nr:hypothetical protein [Rhodobacter sp.]
MFPDKLTEAEIEMARGIFGAFDLDNPKKDFLGIIDESLESVQLLE